MPWEIGVNRDLHHRSHEQLEQIAVVLSRIRVVLLDRHKFGKLVHDGLALGLHHQGRLSVSASESTNPAASCGRRWLSKTLERLKLAFRYVRLEELAQTPLDKSVIIHQQLGNPRADR